MINDVFGLVAQVFPAIIWVAVIAGIVVLARTWSRMSTGSVGAGAARAAQPTRLGLQSVPWDLQGVRVALRDHPDAPLALLLDKAASLGISVMVPDDPNPAVRIEGVLTQLEAALDLPPLTVHPPGEPQ